MIDKCRYDSSRSINYYTERLAGLMSVVGQRRGGRSTHAYTKEVRRALETLVIYAWGKDELIPEIARAHIPDELRSRVARECFASLLEGLLRKFVEASKDISVGSRIELMNIVVSSIAEMAMHRLFPPYVEQFLSEVFPREPGKVENVVKAGESE